MNKVLEIKNVEKYYGNKQNLTKAVDKISFSVETGEFLAIMGASGSGKSTLLNIISTLDKVTSGSILIDGQEITSFKSKQATNFRREKLGFIFQDFNLLDTLTGFENIALTLTIANVPHSKINNLVLKIAYELNITDVLNKYPYQMSGGQKQRIACARALVNNPALVLADEPTGALDSKSSRQLLENFNALNEKLNSTILMVTHDSFTASYADRVLFMKDGKIFNELIKGDKTRKQMFDSIIEVITLLGGDLNDVI